MKRDTRLWSSHLISLALYCFLVVFFIRNNFRSWRSKSVFNFIQNEKHRKRPKFSLGALILRPKFFPTSIAKQLQKANGLISPFSCLCHIVFSKPLSLYPVFLHYIMREMVAPWLISLFRFNPSFYVLFNSILQHFQKVGVYCYFLRSIPYELCHSF